MKKILFVFLIIGSFVIARRYSGADALLETRLLIAGANDIDYRNSDDNLYDDCRIYRSYHEFGLP